MKKKTTSQLVFEAVGVFLLIMTPIASSRLTRRDVNMPILKIKSITRRCTSIIVKRTTKRKTKIKNATWYRSNNHIAYQLLSKIHGKMYYFFSN